MNCVDTLYKANIPATVFTLDDGYVPYFSVVLAGIAYNSSKNKVYDLVVLSTGISEINKKKLADFCAEFPNISLRFYDVDKLIENNRQYMKSNINHINEVAFYRLYIPAIFCSYKKVIFLDCDICVDGDIAELYDVDLKDNYVAAAKCVLSLSKNDDLKIEKGRFYAAQYIHEVLSVPIEDYFNAGVLIFNIKQILKDKKHQEFVEKIRNASEFKYNDQDILNICCHGKVKYLGAEWNFTRKFTEKDAVLAYDSMLNSKIKIYHYVGYNKPWLYHNRTFYNIYYLYATLSPYKDVLLP